MKTYLDHILTAKRGEVEAKLANGFGARMKRRAADARQPRSLSDALRAPGMSIIAEVKLRSPSKGVLRPGADPVDLALQYQENGARAISVLADLRFFGGGPEIVQRVANDPRIALPVLYKDFLLDPVQVHEARAAGADAVLIIARAVEPKRLRELLDEVRALGMQALVEVFSRIEAKTALGAGAEIVGINNRDLQSFQVDLDRSERIVGALPSRVLAVSESGLRSRDDITRLSTSGFDGVLIGESLVTAPDPGLRLREFADPAPAGSAGRGYFGGFGGCFAPETLMGPLQALEEAFEEIRDDGGFRRELDRLQRDYVGRPTPLTPATNLTRDLGGAPIFLKREDLNHTGAHKINNALGQALVARHLGKERIVAETGAGQHGVAVATACALLGLDGIVYMGRRDIERQRPNVDRMRLLGCEVVPVHSGSQTLKDAINEGQRDWVAHVDTTHYILGSAIGPHPFPTMVRFFQSVIGAECRAQIVAATGRLPRAVVACVGGGSNAIGMFSAFLDDAEVELVGVQAGGHGTNTDRHAAPLIAGHPGVLHGTRTYVMQDDDGQISETHSVSAGLDYPGAGPEHSHLKDVGRATYCAVTDEQALRAFRTLALSEGILPALESSHAVARALVLAPELGPDEPLVVNLSGRGDKDLDSALSGLAEIGGDE